MWGISAEYRILCFLTKHVSIHFLKQIHVGNMNPVSDFTLEAFLVLNRSILHTMRWMRFSVSG